MTSAALVSISDYKCWSCHALQGYAAQGVTTELGLKLQWPLMQNWLK